MRINFNVDDIMARSNDAVTEMRKLKQGLNHE